MFRKTIEKDLEELELQNFRKSICVTHLDETEDYVMAKDKINIADFINQFDRFGFYLSRSEDSQHIVCYQK